MWKFVDPDGSTELSLNEKEAQRSNLALVLISISVDRSCGASLMRLSEPRKVWKTLEQTYQYVAAAAMDAKVMKLQSTQMSRNESIVKYVNRLERVVNELSDAEHNVSDWKKRHRLLRGHHQDSVVTANVMRMSKKTFAEPVCHLTIKGSRKRRQVKADRGVIICH